MIHRYTADEEGRTDAEVDSSCCSIGVHGGRNCGSGLVKKCDVLQDGIVVRIHVNQRICDVMTGNDVVLTTKTAFSPRLVLRHGSSSFSFVPTFFV